MVKKILIVDDHPLISQGIKQLLEKYTDFHIVDTLSSWDDLWAQLKISVDILILDLNIRGKNSISIIDEIKSMQPNLKILIFSSYNKPSLVRKTFEKGVHGYVLKDADEAELVTALHKILAGEQFIGSKVAIPKNGTIEKTNDFEDTFSKKMKLSKREKEVMSLVVDGLNNQEIAAKLFISKHTVQTHRKNIFKKMKVHSVTELIKLVHHL